MDELEYCIESGARVLKLLPNVINIDCNDKKYVPFWTRMAEKKIIFLSHTGIEGMQEFLEVQSAHPFLMNNRIAREATLHFLKTGQLP